jgi:hypothetical protein
MAADSGQSGWKFPDKAGDYGLTTGQSSWLIPSRSGCVVVPEQLQLKAVAPFWEGTINQFHHLMPGIGCAHQTQQGVQMLG